MTQIIGSDDVDAVEWFTMSVVDTGRNILAGKVSKPKLSGDYISSEDRIATAVKGTFWRIDEGMFRTALLIHVWLRCGQKLAFNDPAIIMGAAHATMIHDALSLLRGSEEKQDKSQASVLNVSRAAYGQTILLCVKLADIAMRSVCGTNFVWTVIDNFSMAHFLLNIAIKEYGVAENMLNLNLVSNDGVCVPQINKMVVDYYCAVVRRASENENVVGPWNGKVAGGLKWLDATYHAVTTTPIESGRPLQILTEILVHNTNFRTPIGIELLQVTKDRNVAYLSYYYSSIAFGKHFDNRFIEAVAVLLTKAELCKRMKDTASQTADVLSTIPQHLIDKAWDIIANLTFCNEQSLRFVKDAYEQSVILRSTSAVRYIAKAAYEQLNSDADITHPSNDYSKYIEFRLIDGFWLLACMLNLLYETGRPEDINFPGVMKVLEASIIFLEESSRLRKSVDDKGFGYWSCLSKDETKARNFGRNRARVLWRQGWDEMSANGVNFAAVFLGKVGFKHDFTGLPGTAPWFAFQHYLLQQK